MTNAIIAELKRLARLGSPDAIAADLGRRRCKGIVDPNHCPLAVRLKRLTGKPARVTPDRIGTAETGYLVPRTVTEFICRFDSGRYPRLRVRLLWES